MPSGRSAAIASSSRASCSRLVVGRREKVHAVGVGLDRHGAERGQAVHDRGHHLPALGGHPIGGGEVVEVAARERQVAVEGVDEDLERLLQRVLVRALLGILGAAGQVLGADADVAQMVEQRREHAQLVGGRRDAAGQHQRGIERRDVHVQHRPADALLPDGGESAADRLGGAGRRARRGRDRRYSRTSSESILAAAPRSVADW